MTALEKVQVMGIEIEGFAGIHEVEHGGTVFKHGMSQNDIIVGH